MDNLYQYKATVIRIKDGDTLELSLDLGFNVTIIQTVRLARINTKELKSINLLEKELAQRAKERITELLKDSIVLIKSQKPLKTDKYKRYLCEITNSQGQNINDILLNENLAELYKA